MAKDVPVGNGQLCWRMFAQLSESSYIMCRTEERAPEYAPLYIHTFCLIEPRKLLEAQLFNQQYYSYDEIQTVPERLRWCRHHMGFVYKEAAERSGIKRTHYIEFETGNVDYYPKEIVDKLAGLYQIPVEDLLDEYNQFLYKGQGRLIREYRERLGLQKKPFARQLGIDPRTLRGWENETIRVKRGSWERYFKESIEIS